MMNCCKLSLALVCIITTLVGILILALQIVSASTTAWVHLKNRRTSFSFGLYRLEDHIGLVTIKLVQSTPVVVMQAMAIFSISAGLFGIITTVLGATQRNICGRTTKFFIILAQVFISLSAILYLIGVATFTHFWLKSPSKFFQTLPTGSNEFIYGYAYWISWLALLCQLALMLFLIISVNCVIRANDERLAGYEDLEKSRSKGDEKRLVGNEKLGSKKKLTISERKGTVGYSVKKSEKGDKEAYKEALGTAAASVVERAIVEGVNKVETAAPSTSTSH
uniref:uncharacterized protein LOC120335251 n=1 Tax=Styela clava TaxID=7725 RepID=UPI001939D7FB|nr:uncharacterized protein LOC120335251 [Styela clava]